MLARDGIFCMSALMLSHVDTTLQKMGAPVLMILAASACTNGA